MPLFQTVPVTNLHCYTAWTTTIRLKSKATFSAKCKTFCDEKCQNDRRCRSGRSSQPILLGSFCKTFFQNGNLLIQKDWTLTGSLSFIVILNLIKEVREGRQHLWHILSVRPRCLWKFLPMMPFGLAAWSVTGSCGITSSADDRAVARDGIRRHQICMWYYNVRVFCLDLPGKKHVTYM